MLKLYIFTANWKGQEDSVRVVVQASSEGEALFIAQDTYPGFHAGQRFEAYSFLSEACGFISETHM